jgi:putative membrane protein
VATATTSVLIWLVLVIMLGGYLTAVAAAARRGRPTSPRRPAAWCAGLAVIAAGVTGPVAGAAHHDFRLHMVGHLLVGMLAPVLLVAARPVTVLIRALSVRAARGLCRLLGSAPVRVLTHPMTAGLLGAGGLWLLYLTSLYGASNRNEAVHLAVHLHLLLSGYLFTAAVVGTDPAPHRPGFATRAAALVLFLAAHGILAKHLYGHPPAGVPEEQAGFAAMIMYYGGDVIDLVLVVLLCRQWYAATGRRYAGAGGRVGRASPLTAG